MQGLKKGLAILLVICMMATLVPSAALAQNNADMAETVVYNLLDAEVTVGYDTALAEESPQSYKVFEPDGSYTIELEENAFFPYEVQFTCSGVVNTVWFETPDSTVEVGGHTFAVHSEQNDATQISQLGFYVGDDYVPAYPEPKEFSTTSSGIAFFSLLPLEELPSEEEGVYRVNLSAYTPAELNMVDITVSAILSGTSGKTFTGDEAVVWAKAYDTDDEFHIVSPDTVFPISHFSSEYQFIVGSAKQLDESNVRYTVFIQTKPSYDLSQWLVPTLYQQDVAGNRSAVEIYSTYYWDEQDHVADSSEQPLGRLYINTKSVFDYDEELYLGLSLNDIFADKEETMQIRVYKGAYETAEKAEQAVQADASLDITSQIWGPNMAAQDAGYKACFSDNTNQQMVTLVLRDGNKVKGLASFEIEVYPSKNRVYFNTLRDSANQYVGEQIKRSNINNVDCRTIVLAPGYAEDDTYNALFSYYCEGTTESTQNQIEKAVLGHYATLDAAAAQTDIKSQMFSDSGYQANYSGDGVDFTVFTKNNEVYQFTIKVKKSTTPDYEELPDGDPYFQVTGLDGLNLSDVYRIKESHDDYYANGYQTLFVVDPDVDLSSAKLTFDKAKKAKIYANGSEQNSGESEQDFSAGVVQYSASANDGVHLKNYWVTVVKKTTGGAKLFVNGANVKNENNEVVREVFLNDVSGNHHDIFIANLGDAALTGLSATLSDAQNIKLDEYWKVGGAGNDTLAAFTETKHEGTDYGEIANVAKVRLLPDGDGEISGTLTITADGQEPVVIKLTGRAGNPKIVTTEIPDAVKYVPYGSLIQTNNMYDWNEVTFTIVEGNLPSGMEIKSNGELYGVPTETGTFTFTVKAHNGHPRFEDMTATLTLTVLDNTDVNVDKATDTDKGYEVTIRVPDMVGYQDEVFESNGALAEFMDFWLDGQKLNKGTDYIAEEGSTKITVRAQTFEKAGPGKHTIAAEFRVDHDVDKELRRAAQNYTAKTKGGSSGGPSGGGGGSSSSSSGTKPSVTKPDTSVTPTPQPQHPSPVVSFIDVAADAWYAGEVNWVHENGLMVGVGGNCFAPDAAISHATLVTVLSRAGKVDLAPYVNVSYADILEGQWYTTPAKWAKATGIMENRPFSPNPPTPRGELAIMLVNYLEWKGVTLPAVTEPVAFADAADMTTAEYNAFQTLYAMGIFKGKGENFMDVKGATTRAELATLLHRLDTVQKNALKTK